MKLSDLLKRITKLPWTHKVARSGPGVCAYTLRRGHGPVAVVLEDYWGGQQQAANQLYIRHAANVLPLVDALLREAVVEQKIGRERAFDLIASAVALIEEVPVAEGRTSCFDSVFQEEQDKSVMAGAPRHNRKLRI